jgi:hypothetical protein
MAHTITTARILSNLATRATGVRFTATKTPLPGTFRVALAAAPTDGPGTVIAAQTALTDAGYTARIIADGWKLAVTA